MILIITAAILANKESICKSYDLYGFITYYISINENITINPPNAYIKYKYNIITLKMFSNSAKNILVTIKIFLKI
jgi:hypothetical protein